MGMPESFELAELMFTTTATNILFKLTAVQHKKKIGYFF